MSATVIVRRIAANPTRTASEVWNTITDLLAPQDSSARSELEKVGSLAMSLVAAEAMRESPIVVYGVGPRLRIYCLYDDAAILGEDASEDALTWCPTDGDWAMSLPCPSEDLSWIEPALARLSSRVTVRDLSEAVPVGSNNDANRSNAAIGPVDEEAFLRP